MKGEGEMGDGNGGWKWGMERGVGNGGMGKGEWKKGEKRERGKEEKKKEEKGRKGEKGKRGKGEKKENGILIHKTGSQGRKRTSLCIINI